MRFLSARTLKAGSLLIAILAVSTLPALAGETTTAASSKDKNPVIEKPKTEPRFYMDLMAGGEFDIHATHFISNGAALFAEAGTIYDSTALPVTIRSRDFQSTHDAGVINGRLEIGYKVLPYLSVFTGFTYSHSNGQSERPLGSVSEVTYSILPGVGGVRGTYDLFADIGRYQAFAGMAGIKLNTPRTLLDLLHIPQAIKPYASVSAGGKYLDSQNVRFYNGAGPDTHPGDIVDTGRFDLYDASWVFTVEGELGYELQLTRNFSVNLESGYGYDTKPERGELRGTFTGVNKGGDRLYSTVSLGAKLSF